MSPFGQQFFANAYCAHDQIPLTVTHSVESHVGRVEGGILVDCIQDQTNQALTSVQRLQQESFMSDPDKNAEHGPVVSSQKVTSGAPHAEHIDERMEDEEKILVGRHDVNYPALLTKDVAGG